MKQANLLQCTNIGMSRDKIISKAQAEAQELAYENHNVRITAKDNDTYLAVTNEKGTTQLAEISGTLLGSCFLNKQLVLFVHNAQSTLNPDGIYKIVHNQPTQYSVETLYEGNLNFQLTNPIETLGYYESDTVQKVYWVDGLNPNRCINIVAKLPAESYELDLIEGKFTKSTRLYEYPDGTLCELLDSLGRYADMYIDARNSVHLGTNVYDGQECQQWHSLQDLEVFGQPEASVTFIHPIPSYNDDSFDFQGTISNIPYINITKNYNNPGSFTPGTLQYFITYYNKYGVETCIVWSSDLQYITFQNRGAKEDETCSCSFKFDISFTDDEIPQYEYLKVYSVQRNSLDGAPVARVVTTVKLQQIANEQVSFVDYGQGETFNPADIPYLGGQDLRASTIDQKQDTLFLGDVTVAANDNDEIFQKLKSALKHVINTSIQELDTTIYESVDITFTFKPVSTPIFNSVYSHTQQINQSQKNVCGFKSNEVYRFAVQLLSKKGEWTDPIWIGDKYCHINPKLEDGLYHIPSATYVMNDDALTLMNELGYKAVRLLVAEHTPQTRRVVAQGVVNPTMFNYYDRINNKPHSINSWMFRPRKSGIANRHYDAIPEQSSPNAEIQGIMEKKIPGFNSNFLFQSVQDADLAQAQQEELYSQINSYALMIGLGGSDWVTQGRLYYKLYLFINDGVVHNTHTSITDEQRGIVGEGILNIQDNTYMNNNILVDVIEDWIGPNKGNAKKLRVWMLNSITKQLTDRNLPVFISDAMIPTANQLKRMYDADELTDNPQLIWELAGAIAATVAGVVITVCTWGTGAPLAAAAIGTVWSSVAAGLATTTAIVGAAGVASVAEQMQNVPDVDKEVAALGFFTLLPNGVHDNDNKTRYISQLNTWETSMFGGSNLQSELEDDLGWHAFRSNLPNISVLYTHVGKLDYFSPKQKDALGKEEQYYIDESIVTLNSPDLDDVKDLVNDSSALKLELRGTIPIKSVYGDANVYASQGYSSTSQVLKTNVTQNIDLYPVPIEGLLNGALYQDFSLADIQYTDGHWSDVKITPNVVTYKTFLWNRDTSLSGYISGLKYVDPVQLAAGQTTYLNYIPAVSSKKIFANLRYSDATAYANYDVNYAYPHMEIDNPKVVDASTSNLTRFVTNNQEYNYYGNVDTLISFANTPGYTLLNGNNSPSYDEQAIHHVLRTWDPVSIKFNSTDHILIPLKWNINDGASIGKTNQILPYINDESAVNLNNFYAGYNSAYDILGLDVNTNPHFRLEISSEQSIEADTIFPNTQTIAELQSQLNLLLSAVPWWSVLNNAYDSSSISSLTKIKILSIFSKLYTILFQNKNYIIDIYQWDEDVQDYVYTNIQIKYSTTFTEHGQVDEGTTGVWITVNESEIINTEGNVVVTDVTSIPSLSFTEEKIIKLCDELNNSYHNHTLIQFINDSTGQWNETKLSWNQEYPYLFMGELVKTNFDYNNWYGGRTAEALKQIKWNVASSITLKNSQGGLSISNTWGDTYYQRWDCLKTYPKTEQDKNSIVDILSFMVETHKNLDGRSDINRGTSNILNARPSNFNLFNDVYSQQDNFFQYKILDDKFNQKTYPNQIIWSLTKTPMSDIDQWLNISGVNYLNLDGVQGKLNKIINYNDSLLAFQDSAISTIDFNVRAALSTEGGLPVQLGNTGKVTGYTKITDKAGCHNKWSINLNPTGLYFIDDFNKTFNCFTPNGAKDIGYSAAFSQWFKDNITGDVWSPINNKAFKVQYDANTNDIYLLNDEFSLIYNPNIGKFTSFIDYANCPMLLYNTVDSVIAHQDNTLNKVKLYSMFTGDYNQLLDKPVDYWITYRLNPSPYTDNLFTNFTYIADEMDANGQTIKDSPHSTFTNVEAWNEYQKGDLDLTTVNHRHRHAKDRYRLWQGDIPRDGDHYDYTSSTQTHINAGDRMRNPWLFLKLLKKNTNDDRNKMIFHNLTVTYYK